MLLLPVGQGDDVLEVVDDLDILYPMSVSSSSKYKQDEGPTAELFLTASMTLSIPAFFVAAWSI